MSAASGHFDYLVLHELARPDEVLLDEVDARLNIFRLKLDEAQLVVKFIGFCNPVDLAAIIILTKCMHSRWMNVHILQLEDCIDKMNGRLPICQDGNHQKQPKNI